MGAGDIGLVLRHRLEAEHLACEHEGVTRRQPFDEIFLEFAEHASAPRDHTARAAAGMA